MSQDSKEMQDILQKLQDAHQAPEKFKKANPGSRTGRPEVDEMYSILSKLEEATTTAASNLVIKEDKIKTLKPINEEAHVSIQDFKVVVDNSTLHGFKKTYYTVMEGDEQLYEGLALFESAMGIVKELLKDDCNDAKIDKITQLDERYANQLNEAAIYKRKMKQVTESFKQDVYSAKHGTAISKMRSLKANIKKII